MKKKANPFKTLQTIHTAMLAGMVLFCLVSAVVRFTGQSVLPDPTLNKWLQVLVLLVSFGAVKWGFYIFRKRVLAIPPSSGAMEKLAVYKTAAIIKWALIELPVLFAAVAFMITRNYAFIALAFVLIILFALQGPLKAGILLQLQLSEKEVSLVEGSSL